MATTTTTPLLQIPTVTAIQLVPTSRVPLASGTLTLTPPPPITSTETPSPKLLLTINTLTIPLPPTCIAVCTKDKQTYLLATPLSRTDTGFIELTLPALFPAETAHFEAILTANGFLKNALVDDAEDLVYALKKAITGVAGDEVHFSETTHSIVNGAVEGSAKIAELSGIVASAVSNATFEAGRWVGEKLGAGGKQDDSGEKGLVREMVDETIEVTSDAARSLGQSAADASAAVGDSAERAAEENYGQEAKGLVGSAREATGNVGKVAVDAVLGTSVVWQAGEAAVGVAKAGDIEKKDEKVAEMEDVKI